VAALRATVSGWAVGRAGGEERLRAVAVMAAVLALDAADKGAVGATAADLQRSLSIGTTRLGLLVTVTGAATSLSTLPFGVLVDRANRVRLLRVAVSGWAVVMVAASAAPSFGWFLGARVLLGVLSGCAYPAIASLVGDWYPSAERGRVLGVVLSGELLGTGLGIAVAGAVDSLLGWRWAFGLLSLPAIAVAAAAHHVREPERGGAGRLPASTDVRARRPDASARHVVRQAGIEPDAADLVEGDPATLGLWQASRHVLRIRTNVVVVVTSALGYFLLAGARTFGIEFAAQQYGLRAAVATGLLVVVGAGAVVGVLTGGRLADRLLARGRLDARVVLPAVAYAGVVVTVAPAVLLTAAAPAVALLVGAAFFLGATNPPLDATRLDVVPSALWGRAEGIRTLARAGLEAAAPLTFGALAEHVFGGAGDGGLQAAFLTMLAPLAACPFVLLLARASYPRDVAAAMAADDRPAAAPAHSSPAR
jgi:predicted MFS family arabinose efflux permease